jgi:hypothetical protein
MGLIELTGSPPFVERCLPEDHQQSQHDGIPSRSGVLIHQTDESST